MLSLLIGAIAFLLERRNEAKKGGFFCSFPTSIERHGFEFPSSRFVSPLPFDQIPKLYPNFRELFV